MVPHPISLDNYFVNREDTPLNEDGSYNFECLEALDVERFNQDMTRLLKGEYINYRNILPSVFNSRVVVNKDALLRSIEVAALFAIDSQNNLLKLEFDSDTLIIKARSETGRINEAVDINLTGSSIEIAFNAKYLQDIVKSLDDESVALSLTSSVTPCVFEPVQGNSFYYLVLPVRLLKGA